MMQRGNHKSASDPENAPTLFKNFQKYVHYGWMLPITMECVPKIKGASVIPVGVAPQFIIDANGDKQVKRRTTHDASFNPPSKQSIYEKTDRDLLVIFLMGIASFKYCMQSILCDYHAQG